LVDVARFELAIGTV